MLFCQVGKFDSHIVYCKLKCWKFQRSKS